MRFDVLPYLYQLYGEVAHEVFPNPPPTYKPKIVNNIIISTRLENRKILIDILCIRIYSYFQFLPPVSPVLRIFSSITMKVA